MQQNKAPDGFNFGIIHGEKVFELGLKKQMWKEREKEKKGKPSASVRAEERVGEKWQLLKTKTKSPLPAQSSWQVTSVQQSLSPRPPSL